MNLLKVILLMALVAAAVAAAADRSGAERNENRCENRTENRREKRSANSSSSGANMGCAAMKVCGMGYAKGRYFKLKGGIAVSKQQMKVAACFNITGRNCSKKQYVMFDFKQKVGYFATGSSKANMTCYRIPVCKAKSLKCLCPKSWPNSREVARARITAANVPISVYCGKYQNKCNATVKISGIFDKYGVPVMIKKKYKKNGSYCGGAMMFSNLHKPKDEYFQMPSCCRNAKMISSCPKGKQGVPRPL